MHLVGLVPVVAWLWWTGFALVPYLIAVYASLSVLMIRTFLEHQAAEAPEARTVIIERGGPFALLFLNNNLHAVHHDRPSVPWYRIPELYRRERDRYLARTGDYRYRSYWDVFRRYLVAPKEPVLWPLENRHGADRRAGRPGRLPADVRPSGGALGYRRAVAGAVQRPGGAGRGGPGGARPAARLCRRFGWSPASILSQTCGYPYATRLRGRVRLVATPVYRAEGCDGARYRSVLLVRADDRAENLADLRGRRVALNADDSQSGHNALRAAVAPLAQRRPLLRRPLSPGRIAPRRMRSPRAPPICARSTA